MAGGFPLCSSAGIAKGCLGTELRMAKLSPQHIHFHLGLTSRLLGSRLGLDWRLLQPRCELPVVREPEVCTRGVQLLQTGNAACPHCAPVARPMVAAACSDQVCSTRPPGLPRRFYVQHLQLGTEMPWCQSQSPQMLAMTYFWAWEGACPRQCGPRTSHIWAVGWISLRPH